MAEVKIPNERKPMFEPTTSVETIDPELAERLLVHNTTNRKIRQSVVTRYAKDMTEKRWRVGGSTIDFDRDGNLVNGQHRLHACIRAGTPFQAVVVRGVEPEVQEVTDTGVRRALYDLLTWRGEKNTAALAASLNMSWKWKNGLLRLAEQPTHNEVLEHLERNPSIREAVVESYPLRRLFATPTSSAACFIHQANLVDSAATREYLDALISGENMHSGDALFALRGWLLSQITATTSRQKPPAVMYLALFVKAWGLWVMDKPVSTLRWRRGGPTKEGFPQFLDLDGAVVAIRDDVEVALATEGA